MQISLVQMHFLPCNRQTHSCLRCFLVRANFSSSSNIERHRDSTDSKQHFHPSPTACLCHFFSGVTLSLFSKRGFCHCFWTKYRYQVFSFELMCALSHYRALLGDRAGATLMEQDKNPRPLALGSTQATSTLGFLEATFAPALGVVREPAAPWQVPELDGVYHQRARSPAGSCAEPSQVVPHPPEVESCVSHARHRDPSGCRSRGPQPSISMNVEGDADVRGISTQDLGAVPVLDMPRGLHLEAGREYSAADEDSYNPLLCAAQHYVVGSSRRDVCDTVLCGQRNSVHLVPGFATAGPCGLVADLTASRPYCSGGPSGSDALLEPLEARSPYSTGQALGSHPPLRAQTMQTSGTGHPQRCKPPPEGLECSPANCRSTLCCGTLLPQPFDNCGDTLPQPHKDCSSTLPKPPGSCGGTLPQTPARARSPPACRERPLGFGARRLLCGALLHSILVTGMAQGSEGRSGYFHMPWTGLDGGSWGSRRLLQSQSELRVKVRRLVSACVWLLEDMCVCVGMAIWGFYHALDGA